MTVRKDARGRVRDYKKEYERDQSSDKAKANRAARNAARRKAIKKYGKSALVGKDVSHNSLLKNASDPNKVSWKIEPSHKNRGKSNRSTHRK